MEKLYVNDICVKSVSYVRVTWSFGFFEFVCNNWTVAGTPCTSGWLLDRPPESLFGLLMLWLNAHCWLLPGRHQKNKRMLLGNSTGIGFKQLQLLKGLRLGKYLDGRSPACFLRCTGIILSIGGRSWDATNIDFVWYHCVDRLYVRLDNIYRIHSISFNIY